MSPELALLASPAELACAHCGEPVPPARRGAAGEAAYCCEGCATVAAVLRAHDLDATYRRLGGGDRPAAVTARRYGEVDAPAFTTRYVRPAGPGLVTIELYLEGVHCGACVWLVEKLPRLVSGVREARLDLGRSLATVTWDPSATPLSQIARTLDSLGYPPHPYRGVALRDRRRAEDRALLVRLAVAGALAGNVMLIAFALYGGALSDMEGGMAGLLRGAALLLTIPAVLGPGRTFLRGGWAAVRTRTPHMDLPIAVALLVGLGYGAFNTIRGAGEIYFDTVALLVFLLLIGRWLQHRQRRAAADAAELLQSLSPTSARRVEADGAAVEVPLEALAPGDTVLVRAGDPIPSDGRVLEGESRVDAALLTGESRPVRVGPGDAVHAGTVNLSGVLRLAVERTGEETRVGQLMQQVEAFSRRKAPVVQLADRIAGKFAATVLLLAALTLAVWLPRDSAAAVEHAVALLIVTCPCALGLATPLAISVALGRAARAGVLIKGGDVLQRLAERRGRIWLDKTGTLSEGRSALLAWDGDPAAQPLVLALEAASAHPLAAGFREALPHVTPAALDGPVEQVGGGLVGRADGRELRVGSPACLRRAGAYLAPWAEQALAGQLALGRTPVLVAVEGEVRAVAGFGDPLRPAAERTVRALERAGWRVGILSGDHPQVVAAIGAALGLPPEDVHGGLLPEDKLARVREGLTEGPVVMVGDGVNDAAALAAATVGIGVHGGSEATLAAADVFLAQPGTEPVAGLLALSRAALGTVRRNFAISLGYNLVAAALAIAGLITPLVAAVIMPLSGLGVVTSSLRRPKEVPWR